jgi:acetyltransferase-like isoleucine patch superfamily enzyme
VTDFKISFSLRQVVVGFLGNLACSLWFIPLAANFLHILRGVRLKRFYSIYFARNVVLDNRYPERIFISEGCVFAPYCIVLSHSYVPMGSRVVGSSEIIKSTHIGKSVFIGAHSVILPGTILGDFCYVAAGSIVSGVFESNVLIAGNPATIKRKLK